MTACPIAAAIIAHHKKTYPLLMGGLSAGRIGIEYMPAHKTPYYLLVSDRTYIADLGDEQTAENYLNTQKQ